MSLREGVNEAFSGFHVSQNGEATLLDATIPFLVLMLFCDLLGLKPRDLSKLIFFLSLKGIEIDEEKIRKDVDGVGVSAAILQL